MKSCPACKTQYPDDTLQFCLQDGTPLGWTEQADTPTVVLDETETAVAAGGRERIDIPLTDSRSSAWQSSQATRAAAPMPVKKRSNTILAVAVTALGMLILFCIIGLAGLFFWKNRQRVSVSNTNNTNLSGWNGNGNATGPASPTPMPSSTRPSTTPVSTPRATPVSTPLPPPSPELKSYPATTRLKFPRGAYSTSFGGDLDPGGSRSLVLSCRSGQSLSASLSGGSGCVSFRGGGASVRLYTNSGDNYLTLVNNCSTVVHFSVSVTII